MASEIMRYALVRHRPTQPDSEAIIARYLPTNYRVLWTGDSQATGGWVTVIGGRDDHGWTLHGYVIPRLGSGMFHAEEIDLSHPVMKLIPND
jgi:hypothetical protein